MTERFCVALLSIFPVTPPCLINAHSHLLAVFSYFYITMFKLPRLFIVEIISAKVYGELGLLMVANLSVTPVICTSYLGFSPPGQP